MGDLKTRPTGKSVESFLRAIEDEQKRKDSRTLVKMMRDITGERPVMWGESIVGFGRYHYKYASGREGDWFLAGFSPRKANFSLYVMSGFDGFDELLSTLGKVKTGKSCLYIKRLSDVDMDVLRELIQRSVEECKRRHGASQPG